MKVAALDLGTNSFLCLIADIEDGHLTEVLSDELRIVRLGQGLDKTGRIADEALLRAEAALQEFSETIKKHKPDIVGAVATSAARDARNGSELFQLGKKYGIPIEVISGNQEADITFLGGTLGRADKANCAVVDIGGGSTEIIQEKYGKPWGQSFNIGCVRLTERFDLEGKVSRSALEGVDSYIHDIIADFEPGPVSTVIAVAGTPTTLAAMDQKIEFSAKKIEGYRISMEQLDYWTERLAKMDLEERKKIPGLEEKRADVILAGALLLKRSAALFGVKEVVVSTKGVRFGLAMALASKKK